jgi:DNA-binding XRE family transcriptional regulator
MGLGKPRTRLGKWIDQRKIKQEELAKNAGINRDTVSEACSKDGYTPSSIVMKKILKALRDVDPSIRADQFWDL